MGSRDAFLAWSCLNVLNKRRYEAINEVFGGLERALPLVSLPFLRQMGVREDTAQKALLRLETFSAPAHAALLEKKGIRFLSIEDPDYPAPLRAIGDPPIFLYTKGDMACLAQPMIGLVGTRTMTAYGRLAVEAFVPRFIAAGITTVSGLAFGIDGAVAEETLKAGGRTVASLGHGLGHIFPAEHTRLADRIVEAGGLMLSEFPLEFGGDKFAFPARNRIIAGLSLGTVVFEAPEKSGALITADLALDYGRDVFAVPGPIFEPASAGCNALIASGRARLVSAPDEVLRELGIIAPSASGSTAAFHTDAPDEQRVWDALTGMPQMPHPLAEKTGLPPPRLSVALTMLELKGVARNVGGGRWVRA